MITAKYADKTIKINLDVEVPKRLEVSKEFVSLKVGGTEELKLTATYANGTTDDTIAAKAKWTTSNEAVADVTKGSLKAYKSGETIIKAEYGGKTVSILVDVDIPRMIKANKPSTAIQVGGTEQLVLQAIYADERVETITDQAEWTSSSEDTVEVRRGMITGVATGAASVKAKFGTRTVTIPISVGVIKSLTSNVEKLMMAKNGTAQLTLTVLYTDGTSKDVTSLATWAVADASVAKADAGAVTALSSGKTNVTATFENKTVTIPLEVDMAQSLAANPKMLYLEKDGTGSIQLSSTDSNGIVKPVTADAEWSSSAPAIADVVKGIVTAYGTGKATITAKYGGKTVTIPVEVEIIQKLESNTPFLSLKSGLDAQIILTATSSDGKTKDVTAQAEWTTTSYKVTSVKNGLVSGVGYGKASIVAKYAGKSITIPVEVNQLKYLKTDIVLLEMKKGESKKVQAIATYYLDNADEDVSIPSLWTSSNIYTVDVKDGIIKATGTGTATVTVSFAGMKTRVKVVVK
ncbi:Bacterial Ig-like domain (group 2) [compost metagenome]